MPAGKIIIGCWKNLPEELDRALPAFGNTWVVKVQVFAVESRLQKELSMRSDYRPEGMSMWDTWFIEHEGRAHMFHLQKLAPDSTRNPMDENWIGHAVSDDLVNWEEYPSALGPGTLETLDEKQPWTGCVISHENTFYLFYTMRTSLGHGFNQRIGLATSNDLTRWKRYKHNPVIVPDDRWYISHGNPLPRNVVDCRDLIVIKHPDHEGWLGFYAARIPAEEEAESAVIAAVKSKDLIHWEHLSPAFIPKKYACIEVPDVFFINERWYMTCLTGTGWGNRGIFSDPHVLTGTIYAIADHPEGPYREIEGDNTLMGGGMLSGYSCRSLLFDNSRYMFYTQVTLDGHDTLSPPMRVTSLPDGRLRLMYNRLQEQLRHNSLFTIEDFPEISLLPYSTYVWPINAGRWQQRDGCYLGESRTGWQVADLGIGAEAVEIEASIKIMEGVSAGLVFRSDKYSEWPVGDIVFAIDAVEKTVFSAYLPHFDEMEKRNFPIEPGITYHIRVLIHRPRFEIYINNELVVQSAITIGSFPAPSIGLFVDRGRTEIRGLSAYSLVSDK